MSNGSAADTPRPDFAPSASLEALRFRAVMLRRVRQFFDERGFLEVETPLLSADVVIDLHLDPLPVVLSSARCQAGKVRTMWLQTSPEFAMKRLLAAGFPSIYQITHAFRGGERGRLHNPEFTLVEWYAVGQGRDGGIRLLSQLAETLLKKGPAERLAYRHAFQLGVGVDPFQASCEELAAAARQHGVVIPAGQDLQDRDGWLDLLLVDCIEPHLGRGQPTILCDYPPSQAALARIRPDSPPVAERFELYVEGIELANGYHELLEAEELRRRNEAVNRQRALAGKMTLPSESRLLAAMESGLPPCTGVALGFDRLVMLAFGASELAEVLPFPLEIA